MDDWANSRARALLTKRDCANDDILEWSRDQADAAGGGNYQSMINEALRTIATEGPGKIETVVRRVVREELKRAGEPRRPRRAKAA